MKKLEICCYSVESALNAQKGEADRVELCDNLHEGGTTPSAGMINIVRQNLNIGLNVIIRPRGSDFCYSEFEFQIMKKDIQIAKQSGVDGIVMGILNSDGSIDVSRSRELVECARPMPVTFHRAFDMVSDPFQALEDVIKTGADRILSSGLQKTAMEGSPLLAKLIEKANNRIIIMPGGGITEKNIVKISEITGAREFHSSAKVLKKSPAKIQNQNIKMGSDEVDEYSYYVSNAEKVSLMKNLIN